MDTLHAAPLKTLSLDFTRELTENKKTEYITGTLHYDVKKSRVVVEVNRPIKQLMIVKGNVLEIYYPVEKQAFRFNAEGPVPLPFVESIIQATQAEYRLTELLGYTLDKHEVVDRVLYTYWIPPEKRKNNLGTVVLGIRDDMLISTEMKDSYGHVIARTLYQDHSKIGINYIPMKVVATTYDETSRLLQREKIFYSNPHVNAEHSTAILNVAIPESVEVKEIKW